MKAEVFISQLCQQKEQPAAYVRRQREVEGLNLSQFHLSPRYRGSLCLTVEQVNVYFFFFFLMSKLSNGARIQELLPENNQCRVLQKSNCPFPVFFLFFFFVYSDRQKQI